jgi:hypothetical protein
MIESGSAGDATKWETKSGSPRSGAGVTPTADWGRVKAQSCWEGIGRPGNGDELNRFNGWRRCWLACRR